eukprot:EG_transcript_49294
MDRYHRAVLGDVQLEAAAILSKTNKKEPRQKREKAESNDIKLEPDRITMPVKDEVTAPEDEVVILPTSKRPRTVEYRGETIVIDDADDEEPIVYSQHRLEQCLALRRSD